jgi:hypothetical protein
MTTGTIMPRRLPEHCVEDTDRHGNVRIYLRLKGRPKLRLKGVPWSEPFMEAYRAALEEKPATKPRAAMAGTWRWLCHRYFTSEQFKQLNQRTRYVRRAILEATFAEPTKPGATTTFADFPIHRMTPAAVRVLRDRKADTPEAANGRVKAIRQVFKFGIEAKHAATNPAREVPYFKAASDGFHAWTVEEVLQYRARHPVGTKAWLALALLLFVGGRRADIPALGRQHVATAGFDTPSRRTVGAHPSRWSFPF